MKTPPSILIVEDDEDDLYLAERVLRKRGLTEISHRTNGRHAIDYLETRKGSLPDIVLIDLKIPEINGHQVAEWIDGQTGLCRVLRYVLSSSGEERDRTRAAKANVTGYFVKPLTPENVDLILSDLERNARPAPAR